jgi:hypothetical protein
MPSPLVILETLWGYNPINFPRSLGFRQARPRTPQYPPSPGWRNATARHPDVLAAQRRERARIRGERQQRWGRPRTTHWQAA